MLLGAAAPATGTLEVRLDNLRSNKGVIRLCMTAEAGNFPDCKDSAKAISRSVPAGSAIRIEGLAPGDYAVAIIHDENGNSKLDTFAGIPREGFGFSRNPAIGFGPPRFAAARFTVAAGANMQQVKVRYLL